MFCNASKNEFRGWVTPGLESLNFLRSWTFAATLLDPILQVFSHIGCITFSSRKSIPTAMKN